MKIRDGFVSNSSSTAFILAFDKPVGDLADVKAVVDLPRYAKFIYDRLQKQHGIILCQPPNDKCDICTERFRCYAGRGGNLDEVLVRLKEFYYGGEEEPDWGGFHESFISIIREFITSYDGKTIYFLRLADNGEDSTASKLECEMREHAGYILNKLPHQDIT